MAKRRGMAARKTRNVNGELEHQRIIVESRDYGITR